jgi:hypothetical protein
LDAEVFSAGKSAAGREPDPLHDRDRPDAPHRVRLFGFVAMGVAPALWAVAHFLWAVPVAAVWIGGTCLAWGVLSAAAPVASAPLLRGWMFATKPLGVVMTTLILGIVYYLVVTPLALIRRVGNRDPLDIGWSPAKGGTAWKRKSLPPVDSDRWYRPF